MAFSSVCFLVVLVSVPFFNIVMSNENKLTPFGKEVRSLLSNDVFDKTFSVNFENLDDIENAVKIAAKAFDDNVGIPISENVAQELNSQGKRIFKTGKHITSDDLFTIYTNAVSHILRALSKSRSINVQQCSQMYAAELNGAATVVSNTSLDQTLPALTTATGRFLKSSGVDTQAAVDRYAKYLTEQYKKF